MLLLNDSSALASFFMIALVIVAVILFRLWAGSLDGDRIEQHVRKRGGRVLRRTWTPFGPGWLGEKNARIYRVLYEDRDGNRREANVKTSMLSGVYMNDDPGAGTQARGKRGSRPAKAKQPASAPAVAEDLSEELRALELRLLEPGVRASAEALEGLLAEDFREFGASGRSFDRAGIVASLAADSSGAAEERYQLDGFDARATGEGHALATYRLRVLGPGGSELRTSRRSSLWRQEAAGWRMVFHQGTPAEAERGRAPEAFE